MIQLSYAVLLEAYMFLVKFELLLTEYLVQHQKREAPLGYVGFKVHQE